MKVLLQCITARIKRRSEKPVSGFGKSRRRRKRRRGEKKKKKKRRREKTKIERINDTTNVTTDAKQYQKE